jgi:hypothetical protein
MKLLGTSLSFSGGSLALGAASVVVAPIVIPLATSLFKGVLKTGIKTGMVAYGKSKRFVNDTKESLSDIAKEARSEADAAIRRKR